MDTAIHPITHRGNPAEPLRAVPNAQTLSVLATYELTEAGRKTLLLAGGDGRASQELKIQVPVNSLHLVSVDDGVARLKLQPRFERAADQTVIRRDGVLRFDVPPTIEDLFEKRPATMSSSPFGGLSASRRGTKGETQIANDGSMQPKKSSRSLAMAAQKDACPRHPGSLLGSWFGRGGERGERRTI